jgi:hypothetical protein
VNRGIYYLVIQSSIFPAKYVQGADAIAELAPLCANLGKNALLIGDIIGAKNLLPRIRDSFEAAKKPYELRRRMHTPIVFDGRN